MDEAQPAACTARTIPVWRPAPSALHIPDFIAKVAEGDLQGRL